MVKCLKITNISSMNYLTPSALREFAPAAQRLPQSDDKLINTGRFLRHIDGLGYKPVFAAQGTPHKDSDTELKSRHLVVAAKANGECLAILNSHTIWRRAWLGAGFWYGGAGPGAHFLLGAVVPLPRWKGYEPPLEKLLALQFGLKTAHEALGAWRPTAHEVRWLGKKIASTAYFKDHRKPLVKALYEGIEKPETWSMRTVVFYMYRLIVEGGLPPEPAGKVIPPRKLKPIIAPDALMLASSASFQAGMAALNKYKGISTVFPAFRAYSKP